MTKNKIFIDVGPHKTASTFRQRILYPLLPVKYHTMENKRSHLHMLIFSDYYDNQKHIISCENLSGWSYYPNRNTFIERDNMIKNLSRLFPDANIIIVRREIEDWKKSLYKQYVWAGGIDNYQTWLNRMDKRVFDIDGYIKKLRDNFPSVLVVPYQLIKSNHQEFSKQICDYIGVEVPDYENKKLNVSMSKKQLEVYRFFNNIWKTHENPIGLPFFKHWRELLYQISVKDKTNIENKKSRVEYNE
jgi:hypothetical protein